MDKSNLDNKKGSRMPLNIVLDDSFENNIPEERMMEKISSFVVEFMIPNIYKSNKMGTDTTVLTRMDNRFLRFYSKKDQRALIVVTEMDQDEWLDFMNKEKSKSTTLTEFIDNESDEGKSE